MPEIQSGNDGAVKRKPWGRMLSMLGTLALAVGISVAAPTAAHATGGHETPPPTQNVGCEAISADYHRPLTNGDHLNITIEPDGRQVNMYVDQNIAGGASYNGQNNLGLRWSIFGVSKTPIPLSLEQVKSGVITFAYGEELVKLGLKHWTVGFVQSNSTDTWPNKECGEEPVTKVASASVEVNTAATCDAISTVKFSIENATWENETPDLSVGTHARLANAIKDAKFPDGKTTKTVEYTVDDKKPTQSNDPKGDCYVTPPPPTNTDAVFTAPSVVDVCGTAGDKVIYGSSEDGTWSQATLAGDNGTLVHEVTLAPNTGKVIPAPKAGNTYVIKDGKAVWTFITTNEPCPPVKVDNNPKYEAVASCGKAVLTFSNPVTLGKDEIADPAVFTYTDAAQVVQEVTVPANETIVKTVEFQEDSGDRTLLYGVKGEKQKELVVQTDCEVTTVPVTPEGPTVIDKCGTENDGYTIPGKLTSATSSESPEGDIEKFETYTTDKGVYYVIDKTVDGVRSLQIGFAVTVPNGYVPAPGKGDTYRLVEGGALWQFTFTDEKCPVPPTTPPTDTHTPPPVPNDKPEAPKPPVKPSGTLAVTGSEFPAGWTGAGVLTLLAGLSAMLIAKRRRTQPEQS